VGSHTEGQHTAATGNFSHAEGYFTTASGDYQHVQGQYNISSSAQSAFIVGNGTSNTSRSNLVFASGSTFQVTGSLEVTGSLTIKGAPSSIYMNDVSGTLYRIRIAPGGTLMVDTLS